MPSAIYALQLLPSMLTINEMSSHYLCLPDVVDFIMWFIPPGFAGGGRSTAISEMSISSISSSDSLLVDLSGLKTPSGGYTYH